MNLPDLGQGVQTVHPGQADVQDDQIQVGIFQTPHGLFGAAHADDLVPPGRKNVFERPQDVPLIVNYENLGHGLSLRGNGHPHGKGGALFCRRFQDQSAAMAGHDLRGNAQAQSRAFFLGGEERLEDPALNILGHAGTRVANPHDHHGPAVGILLGIGSDADLASAGHGIRGVAEQIQQDLLELGRVGHDGRQGGPGRVGYPYLLSLETGPEKLQRLIDHCADVLRLTIKRPRTGNSRKSLTMLSSRKISSEMMPSFRPKSAFPRTASWIEKSHIFIAVSGLRISWATLAASFPTEASFSATKS